MGLRFAHLSIVIALWAGLSVSTAIAAAAGDGDSCKTTPGEILSIDQELTVIIPLSADHLIDTTGVTRPGDLDMEAFIREPCRPRPVISASCTSLQKVRVSRVAS